MIKVDRRSVVGTHLSANRQKYLPVEVLREASVPVLMIVMLSAANFEVLKLLPWTSDKYDGYPMKRAMKLDGVVILMQTLPMIALSLVFRLLYDLDDELAQVVIALKVLLLIFKILRLLVVGFSQRQLDRMNGMDSWKSSGLLESNKSSAKGGGDGGFGLAGAPHPLAQSRFRAMVLRGPGRSTKRADELQAGEEFLAIGCGDSAAGGSARRSSESARKAFSSKI